VKRRKDKAEPSLEDVALRLAILLPDPKALIGALALAAHGYVRATDDIDFVSSTSPEEIQERLSTAGIASRARRRDPLEGDIRSVVSGTVDGKPFQVLSPPVPIDFSRTAVLPLTEGSRLRVVDLDTLVRLKLRAGGPQDLIDVVHLVRLHPEIEELAVSLADGYGVGEQLDEWISDPRIRATKATPPRMRRSKRTK
jgi:hypothetical protein